MEPDPDPSDQYQAGRATQRAPNENTGDRSVTSKVDSGQDTRPPGPSGRASMVSGCGHSTLGTDKTSTTSTDKSRAQHDYLTRGKLTSEPQLPDFASAKSTSSGRRAPTTRQAPHDTLSTQEDFQSDIADQTVFPSISPNKPFRKPAATDTPQTTLPTQHKQRLKLRRPNKLQRILRNRMSVLLQHCARKLRLPRKSTTTACLCGRRNWTRRAAHPSLSSQQHTPLSLVTGVAVWAHFIPPHTTHHTHYHLYLLL